MTNPCLSRTAAACDRSPAKQLEARRDLQHLLAAPARERRCRHSCAIFRPPSPIIGALDKDRCSSDCRGKPSMAVRASASGTRPSVPALLSRAQRARSAMVTPKPILLVEDDADVHDMLCDEIKEAGHTAASVKTFPCARDLRCRLARWYRSRACAAALWHQNASHHRPSRYSR